ncbi:MAG: hypothetical protein D3906_17390 [Candidatus Electrothrix sp. AUS1_2]|nr:hypothetical protein [Candidatus Electrothrix sp. AUS1_2]
MQSVGRVFTHSAPFNYFRSFPSFRVLGVLTVLLTLFFLTATHPAAACMPTIKHVGDSMSPPNPVAGTSATITFTVYNESQECNANGYKLAFHSVLPATPECLSGSYSGSNPAFSLAAGTTGQHRHGHP